MWAWIVIIGISTGHAASFAHAEGSRLPSPAEVAAFNITGSGWASTPLYGARPAHPAPGVALGFPTATAWGAALPVPTSVVRSAKGKRFHRPGCTAARGQLAVVSVPEALGAGLSACQRCIDRTASLERRRARREAARASEGLEAAGTLVTPAPVASTPAPVASTPAPVASTPAPVASTPAPAPTFTPTPAPAATTQTPSETVAPLPVPSIVGAQTEASPPPPVTPLPGPATTKPRAARAATGHGSEPHPAGTISSAPWDNPGSMLELTH